MQSNWVYTRRSNIAARAWVIIPGEEPKQTGPHKYCTGPDPFWMSRVTSNLRTALNSLPPRPSTTSPPESRFCGDSHRCVFFASAGLALQFVILFWSRAETTTTMHLHIVNNRRNTSDMSHTMRDCHTRPHIILYTYVCREITRNVTSIPGTENCWTHPMFGPVG